MIRLLPLLLFIVVFVTGCASEERVADAYDVRGRVAGFAYGGEAVVLDHDAIPELPVDLRRRALDVLQNGF